MLECSGLTGVGWSSWQSSGDLSAGMAFDRTGTSTGGVCWDRVKRRGPAAVIRLGGFWGNISSPRAGG